MENGNTNTYNKVSGNVSPNPKKSGGFFGGMSKGMLITLGAGALVILVLIIVIIVLIVGGGSGDTALPSEDVSSADTAPSTDAYTFTAPDLVGEMWGDELAERIKPIVIMPENIEYDNTSTAPGGQILSQMPSPGTTLYCDENGVCGYVKITVSGKAFSDTYTSLVGKPAEEALEWLWACGVKKENVFRKYSASTTGVGNGCVYEFTYDNGGDVTEGEKLDTEKKYIISINSYTDSVTLPDLGGKAFDRAVELLLESKLNIGEISYTESGFADGTVLSQTPSAGNVAYHGDKIDLVLSQKAAAFEMPDLLGMTLEEAEALLITYGLELGTVKEQSDREYDHGTVCFQNVAAGEMLYAATVIDIKVSKGGRADPDVNWDAATIIVNLTEDDTFLSAGTMERLMGDCASKQLIAMADSYSWQIPAGSVYPSGDARLDLGVKINGGEGYAEAVDTLINSGYKLSDFAVIARNEDSQLPTGTSLSVQLGFAYSGYNVSLLKYDSRLEQFLPAEGTFAVTENGSVTLPIEDGALFAVVREEGTSYTVRVDFDSERVYCDEGDMLTVTGGSSVTLHFGALDGYIIESVSLNGVVLEGVTGVYTIAKVDSDCNFVINAEPISLDD